MRRKYLFYIKTEMEVINFRDVTALENRAFSRKVLHCKFISNRRHAHLSAQHWAGCTLSDAVEMAVM